MTPAISVALCTYNGEKYLSQQLDSILNQTLKVDEIVVCDDVSVDGTNALLEEYCRRFPGIFKIFRNEINLGSVKNFEKALSACSGDIIFLSDQDDVWVQHKVEDYLSFFDRNPCIQVLASNGFYMDEQSEGGEKYAIWDVPGFLKEKNIAFDYFKLISNLCNVATGASMAVKKEILPEIFPFPIVRDFHHDEWIAIIASMKKSFEMLDGKYFHYRIHDRQQVGRIFYDKSEFEKKKMTAIFDIENFNIDFSSYKKRLRMLSKSHEINSQLQIHIPRYQEYFHDNLTSIEKNYFENKKQFMKRFPFAATILNMVDHILKKRQIKK